MKKSTYILFKTVGRFWVLKKKVCHNVRKKTIISIEAVLKRCFGKTLSWKNAVHIQGIHMRKCNFIKVALQLYWNHTSACVYSSDFAAVLRTFFCEHLWGNPSASMQIRQTLCYFWCFLHWQSDGPLDGLQWSDLGIWWKLYQWISSHDKI